MPFCKNRNRPFLQYNALVVEQTLKYIAEAKNLIDLRQKERPKRRVRFEACACAGSQPWFINFGVSLIYM
jgi:hypothetical protein